jgi:uncharacterized protein YndB with AHSA1/START domain
MSANSIRWPEEFSPKRTRVHVHNELEIAAAPETVWAWLVKAALWPTWYSNSSNVKIEGGGTDLKANSKFTWTTFGVNLSSQVEEFEPPERLAWNAYGSGVRAYHAFLIQKTSPGSHVITEENQNGALARLSNALRPNNMSRYHQLWLDALRNKALQGAPQ